MLRFPVKALTKAQLEDLAKPRAVQGGTSEAIPFVFFDTDTYVSTATTELTFFQQTRANRQLSNLSPAGALPTPQYFQVYGMMFDVLIPAAAASTPQFDTQQLLFGSGLAGTGAPTFNFTYSDKSYGPVPLSCLHGTGGVTGFSTAAAAVEYGNNSIPDGGWYTDGAICLAPNEAFWATITWPVALTLTADISVRVALAGVLHRKVV